MFERFTDGANRVVVLAEEEAGMLNHNYVGTEHILIALIREGTGVAAKALESQGITEEAARQRVEEIVGRGQQHPQREHLALTAAAEKMLRLSMREAIALGNNYISTEHILLGLIRTGESPAAQVLNGLGADPNRVHQEVIKLLSASRGKDGPATGRAVAGRRKRRLLSELGGWIDSVEWRLALIEQRVGTGPDMRQLDQEIAQVRLDMERAIAAQDFENAEVLRTREEQLVSDKVARQQERVSLPSLSDEVERLRDILRQHGIDPLDGAA